MTSLQMGLFDVPPASPTPAPALGLTQTSQIVSLSWYTGKEVLPLGQAQINASGSDLSLFAGDLFAGMIQPPTVLHLGLPGGVVIFTKMNQTKKDRRGVVEATYAPTKGDWRLTVAA